MSGCHKPLCSGAESRRRTTQMGKSSNKAAAGSGLYIIEQGEEDRQPSNQSRRDFLAICVQLLWHPTSKSSSRKGDVIDNSVRQLHGAFLGPRIAAKP